jgi:uncharacterized protein
MDDAAIVAVQLGREPAAPFGVAARCPHGLPLAIRNAPRSRDGAPFPTTYWLTCPAATRACGALESSGRMRELNDRLGSDEALRLSYNEAYRAYLADRDRDEPLPGEPGAGGMPDRVKCLHALVAHDAATGENPIGAIVRAEIEPLDCPGPCVIDGAATPGHPHMKGRH